MGRGISVEAATPLPLDGGGTLAPVRLAYATWGTLDARAANAILLCHALSGDQFAVGPHPVTGRPGWWESMVGPGKPFDTRRFFVICANVIGGCMGSTGPASPHPADGEPWGMRFPVVTIADMVRAQAMLLDHLGITALLAVAGGSMGGMQVLEWLRACPDRVHAAIPMAAAARHGAMNIAFHAAGRHAIMADPLWHDGAYARHGKRPSAGLTTARMIGHITYLARTGMEAKFGRARRDRDAPSFGFANEFAVESYLAHQGARFVERFDANSYLYLTRAMDYFDLAAAAGGSLAAAFARFRGDVLAVAFSSDWLFPPEDSAEIVSACNAAGARAELSVFASDKGHDAFLLDEPEMHARVAAFLDAAAARHGLPPCA